MTTPIPSVSDSEILITDRRAHERIDILDTHFKAQQILVEKQGETMHNMCISLKSIATNVESFTTIFQTLKGIRAFIVWASPVCLALLAFWSAFGDILSKIGIM